MKRVLILLTMVSMQSVSAFSTLKQRNELVSTMITVGHGVLILSGAILTCIFAFASLAGERPRKLSAITALFTAVSTKTLVQNLKREEELEKLKNELSC